MSTEITSSSAVMITNKDIAACFPIVWHHPKQGVAFRVLQPLLRNVQVREVAYQRLSLMVKTECPQVQVVCGVDSRGYKLSTAISSQLLLPDVMIAKKGKLPGKVHTLRYDLEYGANDLEILQDAVLPGEKVVIVDDLLATGGSAIAAAKLVEKCGGVVIGFAFLGVLPNCNGMAILNTAYPNSHVLALCFFDDVPDPDPSLTRLLTQHNAAPGYDTTWNEQSDQKQYALLSHPSMFDWCKQLKRAYPDMFRWFEIKWNRFPDGQLNITFPSLLIQDRDIIVLMSSSDLNKMYEQLAVMRVLPRYVRSMQCWLPYCASLTHERVDVPGMFAAAEPMCKLLSAGIPSTQKGPVRLCMADIHAVCTRFYPTDQVRTEVEATAIHLLMKVIDRENTIIGLPDLGAYKRFKHLFEPYNIPMVWCSKERGEGEKRVVRIVDNNFPAEWSVERRKKAMRYVLLIDDICNSGSTLYQAAQAFLSAGTEFVSCFVTHGVFPNEAYKRFLPGGDFAVFHTFYCTDTLPEMAHTLRRAGRPFYVIPFAAEFARQQFWPKNIQCTPNIALIDCSTSMIKLRAVKEAWEVVHSGVVDVRAIHIQSSDVWDQPLGKVMIMNGLKNRLSKFPTDTFPDKRILLIAFENGGIANRDNQVPMMVDIGGVSVIDIPPSDCKGQRPAATNFVAWSETVPIPDQEIVAKVLAAQGDITFGELLKQKYSHRTDITADDWCLLYGPKTRVQILKETLIQMLYGYA